MSFRPCHPEGTTFLVLFLWSLCSSHFPFARLLAVSAFGYHTWLVAIPALGTSRTIRSRWPARHGPYLLRLPHVCGPCMSVSALAFVLVALLVALLVLRVPYVVGSHSGPWYCPLHLLSVVSPAQSVPAPPPHYCGLCISVSASLQHGLVGTGYTVARLYSTARLVACCSWLATPSPTTGTMCAGGQSGMVLPAPFPMPASARLSISVTARHVWMVRSALGGFSTAGSFLALLSSLFISFLYNHNHNHNHNNHNTCTIGRAILRRRSRFALQPMDARPSHTFLHNHVYNHDANGINYKQQLTEGLVAGSHSSPPLPCSTVGFSLLASLVCQKRRHSSWLDAPACKSALQQVPSCIRSHLALGSTKF